MAITIVSNIASNSFLPVANPINVTVNSNNTGKCNFRYVCDVILDDVNVFRFKLFPDPNTGFGFFQLSDVIGDYLKQNITTEVVTSQFLQILYPASSAVDKTVAKILLRFGEEYDNSTDCSLPVVVYPNLAQSNVFYTYYAGFDYEEWPTYSQADYVINPTVSKSTKFLTKVERGSVEATFSDSYFLDFLIDRQLVSSDIRVRLIVNKGPGQPLVLDFTPANLPVAQRRFRIACGPNQINRYVTEQLFSGYSQSPLIDTETKSYTIQLISISLNNSITEAFEIRVGKPSLRRKRIGFVGSLGGLEYITFFNRDTTRFTIERKNFNQYLTSKKGNTWSYAVGDRVGTTYAVNAKEEHSVSTFVSKKTSEYLYELWLSTDVWFDDRPRTLPFRVFANTNQPANMLFYLEENHGVKVGDKFYSYSYDNTDFNALFTVIGVTGRVIDVGATQDIYNLSDSACGHLVIQEAHRKIPIIPNDNSVEVKQKLERPIEYTLTYSKSVDKITLKS